MLCHTHLYLNYETRRRNDFNARVETYIEPSDTRVHIGALGSRVKRRQDSVAEL